VPVPVDIAGAVNSMKVAMAAGLSRLGRIWSLCGNQEVVSRLQWAAEELGYQTVP